MSKQSKPLVSVIVCTYQHFDGLGDTIQSVLQQDYPNLELIVADDGSDVFPEKQIRQMIVAGGKDNLTEWKIYTNDRNLGTVKNLNKAHSMTHGEFEIELAGDDTFDHPSVVSEIVQRMQEENCDVLATSRLVIGDSRGLYHFPPQPLAKYLSGCSREKQYFMLVSGMYYDMFSGSALAFRKSFFDCFGRYDERYVLWEDGPFLEKYLRIHRLTAAFDIISIRYGLGGVSTGKVHPKLKKDAELYSRTDRVSQIDKVKKGYRHVMIYNTIEDGKKRKRYILLHPGVFFRKAFYLITNNLAIRLDINRSNKKH